MKRLTTDHPMLFSPEMVRALLDNRKTVTRRVVKPQPTNTVTKIAAERYHKPYSPGQILYVREAWQYMGAVSADSRIAARYIYKADWSGEKPIAWRPSIHMPREAARIFLRVTDVRVERLWAVEAEDVLAEGVTPTGKSGGCRCQWAFDGCMDGPCSNWARTAYEIERYTVPFAQLWDSTIKPADRALYGWDANPWVWVIEFERVSREAACPC